MPATLALHENNPQFFGIITSEYLDHIQPVTNNDADWDIDNCSAGRARSPIPAMTRPLIFLFNIKSVFKRYEK